MSFKTSNKWQSELDKLLYLSEQGNSFEEIGKVYGVSRQRIKQVFKRYNLPHKGVRYLVKLRREAEKVDYKLKWGDKDDTDLYRAKRAKFRGKRDNAKRAGIPFNIEFGELVFPNVCPVLGIPIDYFSDGRSENSPSFDRIKLDLGYVSGNVVIMSWRANRIKNDGTAEEHKLIAQYLSNMNEQP